MSWEVRNEKKIKKERERERERKRDSQSRFLPLSLSSSFSFCLVSLFFLFLSFSLSLSLSLSLFVSVLFFLFLFRFLSRPTPLCLLFFISSFSQLLYHSICSYLFPISVPAISLHLFFCLYLFLPISLPLSLFSLINKVLVSFLLATRSTSCHCSLTSRRIKTGKDRKWHRSDSGRVYVHFFAFDVCYWVIPSHSPLPLLPHSTLSFNTQLRLLYEFLHSCTKFSRNSGRKREKRDRKRAEEKPIETLQNTYMINESTKLPIHGRHTMKC